jgi:hypothetical protein
MLPEDDIVSESERDRESESQAIPPNKIANDQQNKKI